MLNVINLNEAICLAERITGYISDTEILPLSELTGRICSDDVYSQENIPSFNRSTMDGFAVKASDTFGASTSIPGELKIIGRIAMGENTALSLSPGTCAVIPTGGMLPENADAVVQVEHTDSEFDSCLVYESVTPGQNVTKAGDDCKTGCLLLKRNQLISPVDVGILAASGVTECSVFRIPRIGIISTGDEIVSIYESITPGKVRDVNSHLISSLVVSYGCNVSNYGIVRDDEKTIGDAITKAVEENDLVLLSGGSSAGEKDFAARIISMLGIVFSHGIAVKPGKPTVIGSIKNKPVFGLPGHPAACYFIMTSVVRHAISKLSGIPIPLKTVSAEISENVSSNHGREEFLCVRLSDGTAYPVYGKSGIISQLTAADGYIRIPRDTEGIKKGETVTVFMI